MGTNHRILVGYYSAVTKDTLGLQSPPDDIKSPQIQGGRLTGNFALCFSIHITCIHISSFDVIQVK